MLKTIFAALLASAAREQGQALIMGVGVIVIGLGAVMISLDIGWWVRDKGDLQNDADAIALAAAGELPDENAALLSGEDVAISNEIDPNIVVYTFEDRNGDTDSDAVRVRLMRKSNSFLAKTFGVPDPELKVTAVARDLTASGACLKPWAVVAASPDPFGLAPGPYVFRKQPSGASEFGPVSWYGSGSAYEESLAGDCYSAGTDPCAPGAVVQEDSDLKRCHLPDDDDPVVDDTLRALDDRYFDLQQRQDCDASVEQEAFDRARLARCANRLVTIAIVDDFIADIGNRGPGGEPKADVHLFGIATFYVGTFVDVGVNCGGAGEPDCVVGFLLPHSQALPQWQVVWVPEGNPANGYTPISIALVE